MFWQKCELHCYCRLLSRAWEHDLPPMRGLPTHFQYICLTSLQAPFSLSAFPSSLSASYCQVFAQAPHSNFMTSLSAFSSLSILVFFIPRLLCSVICRDVVFFSPFIFRLLSSSFHPFVCSYGMVWCCSNVHSVFLVVFSHSCLVFIFLKPSAFLSSYLPPPR